MGRIIALFVGAFLLLAPAMPTSAESSESPHYRFDETTIGSGGVVQSSSNSYKATSGLGDLAAGHTESGNYQSETGSKTTHDPTLSFKVDTANASFGNFSAGNASTATATFSVLNYTSYGYVVHIVGNAPTYANHVIKAMDTTDISKPGMDQFGINLVANTDPISVGANPKNGQFGFGEVTDNYSTPNKYRYVSGEAIAKAPKSSGETDYTISYLVNVAGLTPGGKYSSDQTLIVTGTY